MNLLEKLLQKPWEQQRKPKRIVKKIKKRVTKTRAVLAFAEIPVQAMAQTEETPNLKPDLEKERKPEKIVELGIEILNTEDESLDTKRIRPTRKSGFMLATVLAMTMALAVTPEKAEAQNLGNLRSTGTSIAGRVLRGGSFEAGSAIDRVYGRKNNKIEHTYMEQLKIIEQEENALYSAYSEQKNKLESENNKEGLENLEQEYQIKKNQITQDKLELRGSYQNTKGKVGVQKWLINQGLRVGRGW